MKLNRKQLRKLILREMAGGPSSYPMNVSMKLRKVALQKLATRIGDGYVIDLSEMEGGPTVSGASFPLYAVMEGELSLLSHNIGAKFANEILDAEGDITGYIIDYVEKYQSPEEFKRKYADGVPKHIRNEFLELIHIFPKATM